MEGRRGRQAKWLGWHACWAQQQREQQGVAAVKAAAVQAHRAPACSCSQQRGSILCHLHPHQASAGSPGELPVVSGGRSRVEGVIHRRRGRVGAVEQGVGGVGHVVDCQVVSCRVWGGGGDGSQFSWLSRHSWLGGGGCSGAGIGGRCSG